MIKQLNKYRMEGRLKEVEKNWSYESTRRRSHIVAYYCHCVWVLFVLCILTFIFTSQFRHKHLSMWYASVCVWASEHVVRIVYDISQGQKAIRYTYTYTKHTSMYTIIIYHYAIIIYNAHYVLHTTTCVVWVSFVHSSPYYYALQFVMWFRVFSRVSFFIRSSDISIHLVLIVEKRTSGTVVRCSLAV